MNARHLRFVFYVVGLICFAALALAQTASPRPPRDIMRKPSAPKKRSVDPKVEAARLNNLGVAYMNQQTFPKALEYFTNAANLDPALFTARVNRGIALMNMQRAQEARTILEKATQEDPQSGPAWFNLGLLEKADGRKQEAVSAFSKAAELAPQDPEAFYFLGAAQSESGDQPAAIEALQRAIELNPYHVSAEFALARAYQRSKNPDEARVHLARFQQLTQKKLGSPISLIYGEQGKLSLAQQVKLSATPAAAIPVKFSDVSARVLQVGTKADTPLCAIETDKAFSLLLSSNGAAHLSRRGADGAFVATDALPALHDVRACAAADFDNDGDPDLAIATGEGVKLLRHKGAEKFDDVTASTGIRSGDYASSLTFFDYDHDGDLDLFIGSASGKSALWRNNGNGTFTDVSEETGFAIEGATTLIPTDFNNDRAIDAFLLSVKGPATILTNPREGKFQPLSAWPSTGPVATSAVVADFDKNGWMDVVLGAKSTPALTFWTNEGGKLQSKSLPDLGLKSVTSVVALDYDNDGWIDLAVLGEGANGAEIGLLRNAGPNGFQDATANVGLNAVHPRANARLSALDIDGDGDTDLIITSTGAAPIVLRNDGGNRNQWLAVALRGLNDNKSAIGTKLEIFATDLYQKFEVTGLTGAGQSAVSTLAGLGGRGKVDIVRTLWPTGVLQDEIEIAARQRKDLLEIDRRGSSCPVLFAWDGTQYRFVADMIGSGVFGHWVAPGQLNVPDPTEYVKLEGIAPAVKNGLLSFRFMEPMEETVYVDQLRLLAIDHPANVDVFPNERFMSNPPFPDFKVITTSGVQPPVHAEADGEDVTHLLRARDRRYVDRMELLPYRGFTKTHTLDLNLGGKYAGGPLRLLLHGYIEYFTATGMYAAHQAGIDPMSPTVDAFVNGQWVRVDDDMGFPAGLRRTIVADLTDKLPRGTDKVRITTNLQIYWDQILIDRSRQIDTRVSEVPLASAKLRFHGYPREVAHNAHGDITYVYEQVSATGPYTHQNGAYTRFGDVKKSITNSDDRFVVFGSGEEIAIDFDPSGLPALPHGWKRDYFFFADGYEKDMDFYAADFLSVEPMPFHAMETYPGIDGRNYPTEKHLDDLLENDRFGSAEAPRQFRFEYPKSTRP
jgi:Tfp pilus assembly protein PilF